MVDGERKVFDDASDVWFDGIEIHMQRGGNADIYVRPEYQVVMSMDVPYQTRHPKPQETESVRIKRQRKP